MCNWHKYMSMKVTKKDVHPESRCCCSSRVTSIGRLSSPRDFISSNVKILKCSLPASSPPSSSESDAKVSFIVSGASTLYRSSIVVVVVVVVVIVVVTIFKVSTTDTYPSFSAMFRGFCPAYEIPN